MAGCAPDPFLGSGIQSAVKVVIERLLGDIVGGSVIFFMSWSRILASKPRILLFKRWCT